MFMDMDADALTNLLISLVGGLVGVVFVLLRADIKNLRADLNGLRGEFNGLRGEFNGLRGEFNGLRGEFNGLRGEFNGLRGEFNEFRSDTNRRFDEVLATQKEHGERLSRLETLVSILMGQFHSGATDPETGEQAMLAYRARGPDEA